MTIRKRPAYVTCLAAVVFLLSTVNLASLYGSLVRLPVLSRLDLALPPWVIALSGGLWGAGWLAAAIGLWGMRPWAHQIVIWGLPAYMLMTIGQQVLLARGHYERGRLGFLAGASLLGVSLLVFLLTRPSVRQAFHSMTEPTKEPEE
jgi:hypothetical protein